MPTQKYKAVNFRSDSWDLVIRMNSIIEEYVKAGYRLTVRQLYYQLVARGVIENTERSYKRITSLVNDAKLGGWMDWEAIEDRTREFIRSTRWRSAKDILNSAAAGFHMDLWDNQPNRVFVIVEKEALAGVLQRACGAYDVPLLAARGYPSGTVLREFCVEDINPAVCYGQHVTILHLGDHDPSGIDMSRDLEKRILLFADTEFREVTMVRIALTMDQIRKYKPPPNPAKNTDTRFRSYKEQYGEHSWELDALRPEVLDELVRSHIINYIDDERWEERCGFVESIRTKLKKVAKDFA